MNMETKNTASEINNINNHINKILYNYIDKLRKELITTHWLASPYYILVKEILCKQVLCGYIKRIKIMSQKGNFNTMEQMTSLNFIIMIFSTVAKENYTKLVKKFKNLTKLLVNINQKMTSRSKIFVMRDIDIADYFFDTFDNFDIVNIDIMINASLEFKNIVEFAYDPIYLIATTLLPNYSVRIAKKLSISFAIFIIQNKYGFIFKKEYFNKYIHPFFKQLNEKIAEENKNKKDENNLV